jgi:hypothetical protein
MSRHEGHATEAPHREGEGGSQLTGLLSWISEKYCGFHGHDNLLQFESDRMFLKCVSCGHESPGWEINEPAPITRVAGDRARHILVRAPLVSSRRVA